MSGFGVPPLTRGVKWLALVTVAVSVLVPVLGKEWGSELAYQVSFVPAELWHGKIWQPFTYTFLNDDPLGLVFALLGLWMLGSTMEQRWGTRRFVTFYFIVGVTAALATAIVGLASSRVAGFAYYANWAPVEGLIAAYAVLMPDAQILLYVVPVPARWMLPISAGLTVLFMLMRGWVPYLPQLFGIGAGVLFAGRVAPKNLLLRVRMWWLDRRLRRSRLRVGRGAEEDRPFRGKSGSDKYLH
jgi:membrane associated rhomboid family serine protease